MSWNFFTQIYQFFKLIILISYLLDNSPEQGIKSFQVTHHQRLHAGSSSMNEVYGCLKKSLLLTFCLILQLSLKYLMLKYGEEIKWSCFAGKSSNLVNNPSLVKDIFFHYFNLHNSKD